MAPGHFDAVLPIYKFPEIETPRSKTTRSNSSTSARSPDVPRSEKTSILSATKSFVASAPPPTSTSQRPPTSRTASAPNVRHSKSSSYSSVQADQDAYNYRDSVTSIKDDPFFRNYQTPQSVSLAQELRSAGYNSLVKGEGLMSAPGSGMMQNKSAPDVLASPNSMENINIFVIGAAGVGKSTLIQRALGMRSLPSSISSSLKMSVDQSIYTVSLIELDLESFDVDPDRKIQWPKQMNGQITPRIDGALLLYDVMNRESISDLPQTLNALVHSLLPTILVSCKCDNPINTRQIDTDSIEAACLTEVQTVKTASNVPESARLCLGAMLRAIMAHRNSASQELPSYRRRAASSANTDSTLEKQESRPESKHSRASSELSLLKGFPSPPLPSPRGPAPLSRQTHLNVNRTNLHYQYTIPAAHTAPPLSAHPAFRKQSSQDGSDSETGSSVPFASKSAARGTSAKAGDSFLDMDESDTESGYGRSEDVPILQRSDAERPAKVAGLKFDELVDRLLSQHMSKADSNFQEVFLCLYRKFAAPIELFSAIEIRLEQAAEDTSMHYLTRTGTQLRIIAVIAKWVSTYPGDFASPYTSQKLNLFVEHLSAEPAFATAAQEMRTELEFRVVEDDDTGWARTDADAEAEAEAEAEAASDTNSAKSANTKDADDGLPSDSGLADELLGKSERPPSQATSHVSHDSAPPTIASTQHGYHSVEDYEAEAGTLVPMQILPLTKFRYHMCLDVSDDDFASEITRIDWVMFSSIRVRDLVRHVSLPLALKGKCKSLANVNRMIDHFNHIAKWVANMVLLRDKAKHRALMLEKFMRIALKLRQLNNYNGLAAVIAGINGSAIHRLSQTRALVNTECHKRFMRLELLMGSAKSHFAYRLAWENSSTPRIPFVPLHRRDLVSAEEGSRTFVGPAGDRINWKKFEVLAEVILPIMRSQGTPYTKLERHDSARELLLHCKMQTDEEEIYQRSLSVESSAAGNNSLMDVGKKKFPWFQK